MEGRSTEEIAAELGIKESAVRHTVSRARASLRRVLTELVIDEKRGLTALDMLSTTYKKAADLAKKSSKVAFHSSSSYSLSLASQTSPRIPQRLRSSRPPRRFRLKLIQRTPLSPQRSLRSQLSRIPL
jgi:hypothetical protein